VTDSILTADQVAEILGVDRVTVLDLSARGIIPTKSLGRTRMFRKMGIEDAREYIRLALICRPTRTAPVPLLEQVAIEVARLSACGPARGWVYALHCESVGLTKIGRAVDPIPRIAELERMNAAPLTLLGLAHGQDNEQTLHRRYAERRAHGEWFALPIGVNPLAFDGKCTTCRGAP